MHDMTGVLNAIEQGDPLAAEQLLPLVYRALRELAAAKLAQEQPRPWCMKPIRASWTWTAFLSTDQRGQRPCGHRQERQFRVHTPTLGARVERARRVGGTNPGYSGSVLQCLPPWYLRAAACRPPVLARSPAANGLPLPQIPRVP
jgi:hypothetical protein